MNRVDGYHKIHRIFQNVFFNFVGSVFTVKIKHISTEMKQLLLKWKVADR
jgi:hypothetical protein